MRAACAGLALVALSGSIATADVVTDTAFVNRAYNDLLGRTADPAGLATGLDALVSAAVGPWLNGLLGSTEYRAELVAAFYQSLLQRDPTPGELSSFVALLGSTTDQGVQASLAGSVEYFGNAGGTDAGFVQAVFQDFLNRTPTGPELSTFLTLLATLTREQVANAILASAEHHEDLLGAYYDRFLGRPVDAPGLAAFLPGLNDGTLTNEAVIAAILASREYYERAQLPLVVPEPAPWTLFMGVAMAALLLHRYRHAAAASEPAAGTSS